MKPIFRTLILTLLCLTAKAQEGVTVLRVYLNDGTRETITLSQIDSIRIEQAGNGDGPNIPLTPDFEFPFDGTSSLPIIFVTTEDQQPWNDETKGTYRSITELQVANSECDAIIKGARIKGRGNSSWTFDKKAFTLKLGEKTDFAGLPKHKSFALVANYCDKTLMRNSMAYRMGREIYTNMPWNPNTVNVHLVMNGEYMGLYMLTETAKIDSRRIDVPNIEKCPSIEEAHNYGFLLEANYAMDEDFNFTTKQCVNFSLKDPDGNDISPELCKFVQDHTQKVEDALYSGNYEEASKLFDMPSFVDWYIVNELAKNLDACYTFSCFLYFDPADGKLHSAPLWDFDIGFGNIYYNGCDNPEGLHINSRLWPSQLFEYDEVRTMVRKRWDETRDRLAEFCTTGLQDIADALAPDAGYNFTRWPILGEYVFPNALGWEDRTTYQSEIDYLKDFLRRRIEWLDGNIGGQYTQDDI